MTGKIGRKKVLKFRDFPTRLRGEVFFVENGYDEKLNLSIINHLLDINNLFISKSIHFNYFPFLGPHFRKTALYSYPAMNKGGFEHLCSFRFAVVAIGRRKE